VGADHQEPTILDEDKAYTQTLAQFSAAWFKVFLDETPQVGLSVV
jgi:hypothetical protein